MCEPTTIMTALALTSAAAGTYGQYRSASAQEDALNEQARIRAEENADAAETQLGERVREARKERARIRVAAGESGVAGLSVAAQLSNSFLQQSQDVATIRRQAHMNQRAANAATRSEMSKIVKPTALSAGLQIAAAGYRGYSTGLQIKRLEERG